MAPSDKSDDSSPAVNAPTRSGDIEKTGDTQPSELDEKEKSNWNKPYQFYLASLSLWLIVLLVSLDSTGLAVAIPVRSLFVS